MPSFKDLFVRPKSSEERAAETLSKATKELGEKFESISQAEIRSKDRVDIPLSEYLRMKDELEHTSRALRHARALIATMGIPAEIISAIDPDSVCVYTNEDLRDFKRHYQVRFSVDTSFFI
jgi:hypothetical protein